MVAVVFTRAEGASALTSIPATACQATQRLPLPLRCWLPTPLTLPPRLPPPPSRVPATPQQQCHHHLHCQSRPSGLLLAPGRLWPTGRGLLWRTRWAHAVWRCAGRRRRVVRGSTQCACAWTRQADSSTQTTAATPGGRSATRGASQVGAYAVRMLCVRCAFTVRMLCVCYPSTVRWRR